MTENFAEQFAAPGTEYRGIPFWSWNGKLEPEKLRRQIRSFRELGFGGFFMHSRVGLKTPYLGKEWFDCIRASIDEAKKQSLTPYLYDEDRWASGAAGGFVTRDPRYRAWILYLRIHSGTAHPNSFGFWSARLNGSAAYGLHRGAPAPGETGFELFAEEEPCSDWFNGFTYLDMLNPEAVKRFIEITYERYYRELGADFGSTVPAVFTDEPHYWRYGNGVQLPYPDSTTAAWTPRLPELFRERFGYELADHLPELFYDCPDRPQSPARYHYWRLLTELFVDSFSKQVGAWCGRHNIALTGHLLWEDAPSTQTRCVGASMRHYPHMQIPGIDQLTEYAQLYDACKQLSSAARQFNRPRRISEIYGCTGWDMSFAGYKAIGDWQYALGVNMRCLHLSFYTMAGEAKRDYPASFSRHSSFAKVLRHLEDYFARLGVILNRGSEVRDLLVIHPVESAWTLMNRDFTAAAAFDRKLAQLRNRLLDLSLDFDYGDEEHLAAHGSVDGSRLRLGSGVYKAVLLPEMTTIRRSTIDILKRFIAAGGIVSSCGAAPKLIDGVPGSEAGAFWRELPGGIAPIEPATRRISIRSRDGKRLKGVLYQLRESDESIDLFLCNTGFTAEVPDEHHIRCSERKREIDLAAIEVVTSRSGFWYELIPETGAIRKLTAEKVAGTHRFTTSFKALQSKIFRLSKSAIPGAVAAAPFPVAASVKLEPAEWRITRDEPNVLVLDHATWQLGNGTRHERDFILRIDDAIRRELGIPIRGGRMVQPWARRPEKPLGAPLELEYEIQVNQLPGNDLHLAIEEAESWELELNGSPLRPQTDCGFWIDESIRKRLIPKGKLHTGRNNLKLRREYRSDSAGLEAIYLLGEFCVENDAVSAVRHTLPAGDWCGLGFPYYAGNMTYRTSFRHNGKGRVRLLLGEHASTALRILLNGEEAGVLGWEPYELELEGLRTGENELGIELIGSRRNALGPFFLSNPYPLRFGANEFREYSHPEYRNLTPYGLFTPPMLLMQYPGS